MRIINSLLVSGILGWTLVSAEVDAKAASYNLTSTWYVPMPNTTTTKAFDYIAKNWYISNKKSMYGSENISFMKDPIENQDVTVLKVVYPERSYAPIGTKNLNTGTVGGVEFYSLPNGKKSFNSILLSYDLAFDSSFEWVKGGKLPGIYGGTPGSGCSGGEQATGNNCFSMRLMWRKEGAGEAYGYIPENERTCKPSNVYCNSEYGVSFSRGIIRFETNKWTKLEMYVKLNSGSDPNGILKVWQDGSLVINQQQIQYRASDLLGVSSLMFSTFFGGGSEDYATLVNTSAYYKNIQFSVGNTPDPVFTASAAIFHSNYIIYVMSTFIVLFLSNI